MTGFIGVKLMPVPSNTPLEIIWLVFVPLALLALYAYTTFYYKKDQPCRIGPNGEKVPFWFYSLSAEAQKNRLEEINKQKPKLLRKGWFKEYWQGNRTPLYAWFMFLIVPLLFFQAAAGYPPIYPTVEPLFKGTVAVIIMFLLSLGIRVLGGIILWRCAKNSVPTSKYFARFIAVIPTIGIVLYTCVSMIAHF